MCVLCMYCLGECRTMWGKRIRLQLKWGQSQGCQKAHGNECATMCQYSLVPRPPTRRSHAICEHKEIHVWSFPDFVYIPSLPFRSLLRSPSPSSSFFPSLSFSLLSSPPLLFFSFPSYPFSSLPSPPLPSLPKMLLLATLFPLSAVESGKDEVVQVGHVTIETYMCRWAMLP